MHIDFDLATRTRHSVEDSLPKVVAAFAHPTFSMRPDGYAANLGTCLEQCAQRIARVGGVILACKSVDRVVRARGIGPLVAVSPDSKLELNAMRYGLAANELQHLEVLIPLDIA